MAITSSDLKIYTSVLRNDLDTNGGVIGYQEVVPEGNNLVANYNEGNFVTGRTVYTKAGFRIATNDNEPLQRVNIFISQPTTEGDYIVLRNGTFTDIQADIQPTDKIYGAGYLTVDANAGDTTISVGVEQGALPMFDVGDTIIVSAFASNSASNSEELAKVSAVSVAGDVFTLTLEAPLKFTYTITTDFSPLVANTIQIENFSVSLTDINVTSSNGLFDNASSPVVLNNFGTVADTYTIVFDSPSTFTVSGNFSGNLGNGNISATFNAPNIAADTDYFSIPASVWGGTFAAGDTITFRTLPAIAPFWIIQNLLAGTASDFSVSESRITIVANLG